MKNSPSLSVGALSRRCFLVKTALGASAVGSGCARVGFAAEKLSPPVVVFSKVFQALKFDFEAAAGVAAEAELDGIDCPVRPGGEVLPERAVEDLPRYAEALRQRGLQMPLITSAITSTGSPHAEAILRTAKKLGVRCYRLGFIERASDLAQQLREVKAQLKDLAALNLQIGLGAVFQNHSPSGRSYLGGDLGELRQIVSGFDSAQVGVAFDVGHALIVHGDGWREHFEKLRAHLKVAYVKDATREGRWVPFGEGDVGQTGYFKMLQQMGCHAPFCLHIEFDWSDKGKNKTRAALVKALEGRRRVLKEWLAAA